MVVWLILLIGLSPLYQVQAQQRNCGDGNNGGCSSYCIDRNDGNGGVCGCECYFQLASDQETCEPIDPCNVDMLFMYDFTKGVASDCSRISLLGLIPGLVLDFTPFEAWRDFISQYVNEFPTEILSGEYAVGTMVSGKNMVVTNNYGDQTDSSVMASQISGITVSTDNICGTDYIFRAMYFTFESNAVSAGQVLAPTSTRDPTTTSRVAVVTMLRPMDSAVSDATLDEYTTEIHAHYDQVFVVGKQDTSQLGDTLKPLIDPQLRLLACQDRLSTNCPYLFYTDATNDNGASFGRASVEPMIDRGACVARKAVNAATSSCSGSFATVTIPTCLLGGLTKADLVLNDASCTGDTYATLDGGNVVFTISYEAACAWTLTETLSGDITYVQYEQHITTKVFGVTNSAKALDIAVSCSFPRYTDEQLGIFDPAVASFSASLEENGSFDYEFMLYTDENFDTPVTDFPLTVSVTDTLYFRAAASIPSDLKMLLSEVKATTSADRNGSPSHDIITERCAVDSTFNLVSSTSDEFKFTLQMFEFTSTAGEANGAKDPVFMHITMVLCLASDSSAECTQSCGRRKRRDAPESETTIKRLSIGPFHPKRNTTDVVKTEQIIRQDNEVKEDDKKIYVVSLNSSFAYACWLVPVAVAVLLLCLGSLFILKKSVTKVKLDNGFDGVQNGGMVITKN